MYIVYICVLYYFMIIYGRCVFARTRSDFHREFSETKKKKKVGIDDGAKRSKTHFRTSSRLTREKTVRFEQYV